jgi:hypothetical protein
MWSDHVFAPNYVRLTLDQIRQHIDANGFLPWMRSEDEVATTGVDPAGDLADLLETVENLFLVVFELYDSLHARDGGLGDAEGQLDAASAEFLQRLLLYAKAVPPAR